MDSIRLICDKKCLKLIVSNIFLILLGLLVGRFLSGCALMYFDNDDYADYQLDPQRARDTTTFMSMVTVVSVCKDDECVQALQKVLHVYPQIKVLVGTLKVVDDSSHFIHMEKFDNRADALNKLISKVETEYFLHLDEFHGIDPSTSDQSVGWLLESLEKIKSFDIIGGSVHVESTSGDRYNALEIPCYRLHHYNYTYSETYEYKESILDIMVCEKTSTSFLARTAAYKQSGLSFDPRVMNMVFVDFFLQAKKRGLTIGTKPEVFFMVLKSHNRQRSVVQHVTTDFVPDLIPFGLKHQVMTIVDWNKQTLYICESYKTAVSGSRTLFKDEETLCNYNKAHTYWNTKHWSKGGMFTPPTILFSLKRAIKEAGAFFDKKGWKWALRGGAALGVAKLRGILPWHSGHINIDLIGPKKVYLDILNKEFIKQYPEYTIQESRQETNKVLLKSKHSSEVVMAITFLNPGTSLEKVVHMNFDGHWVQVSLQLFTQLRFEYGEDYFQHKMPGGLKYIHCSEQSNACLPDYRKINNGRGGIWAEYFVEI